MKLPEIYIGEREIAETYSDGEDIYDRYHQVMGFKDDITPIQIAEQLNMAPSSVRAYIRGSVPRPMVYGIDPLNKKNLLPLNSDHWALPLLNLLIAAGYWHGARSNTSGSATKNIITISKEHQIETIRSIFTALDYDVKAKRPLVSPHPIGRLMSSLTYPRGKKTESTKPLPKLVDASNNSAPEELALDLLKGFISTLLYFRAKFGTDSNLLHMISFNDKDVASDHTEKICNIAKLTHPHIDFQLYTPDVRKHSTSPSYYGMLSFEGEGLSIDHFQSEYEELVTNTIKIARQKIQDTKKHDSV